MISVKRVYEVLRDLANKEQRGFVSPGEFNTMAPVAQMAIYNKMWDEVLLAESISRRNIDGQRGMSKINDVRNELAAYLKKEVKSSNTTVFAYPDDFYKLESITTVGVELNGDTTAIPIDITYDPFKITYIRKSTLSKPTLERPVAVASSDLEVYPRSVPKIEIRYFCIPQGRNTSTGARTTGQPEYSYTIISGDEVYYSSTSVDFDLPEDREPELVIEMAGMIGTSLRDAALINYGRQQN